MPFFAESNSEWFISMFLLFFLNLQNYCKAFLFHPLQHSVFHIWIAASTWILYKDLKVLITNFAKSQNTEANSHPNTQLPHE